MIPAGIPSESGRDRTMAGRSGGLMLIVAIVTAAGWPYRGRTANLSAIESRLDELGTDSGASRDGAPAAGSEGGSVALPFSHSAFL